MAERDAQDAERLLLATSHRHDDLGGARDPRVTGGPGGHRNPGHVEGHEDGLGAGGGQGQVDDGARRGRLPHRRIRSFRQVGQQVRAQVGNTGGESGALGDNLGEGGTESTGTRDVWRARANRALVAAAGSVGRHGDASSGKENADARRGADLVAADAHEVQAELRERHVQGWNGLGGVAVHEASAGVHELSEVSHRLNRADLGGHKGHRSEREATIPRGGRMIAVNTGQDGHAARIHGQNLPGEALARGDLALMGDSVMLQARDNDQVACVVAPAHPSGRSHHAEGVGFGGAGREDDLVDVCAEGRCDLLARVVEHATGPPPSKVEGGGVAGGCGQVTLGAGPRLEGALAQRRGGRVVEVDAHAWERASSMAARAAGTTSVTSPTTPKSAISKIGASGSSHTATMWAEDCMPTVWWIAPDTPRPM